MVENQIEKYESKNPISNYLVKNFFKNIEKMINSISSKDKVKSALEAGCGDGYLSQFLIKINVPLVKSFDISESLVTLAKNRVPSHNFYIQSIYEMDRCEDADLIICCEVLEHLETPDLALEKIYECSQKYVILSVPNEPIWRILNILRGKYLSDYGNTFGHINHWSKNKFIKFVEQRFEIIKVATPLPWTMILAKKVEGLK